MNQFMLDYTRDVMRTAERDVQDHLKSYDALLAGQAEEAIWFEEYQRLRGGAANAAIRYRKTLHLYAKEQRGFPPLAA